MFDDDTQLSLEYYSDPEIDDGYPTLCVRHTNYNKHILNMMDELRAGCKDELSHQSGWFLVTTDFQKPRMLML
jgi:hypothetical protein